MTDARTHNPKATAHTAEQAQSNTQFPAHHAAISI
jgi:hypothetical protein